MASLYSSARSSLTAFVYRNIESENAEGVEAIVFPASIIVKGVASVVACSLTMAAGSFSGDDLQEDVVSARRTKGLISLINIWVFTFICHMIHIDAML